MKKFNKVIALILCVTMLLPVCLAPVSAETVPSQEATIKTASVNELDSVFAEGEDSLIVFVTGIGQSWSYFFDEKYTEEGAFENGTLQDYENYAPLVAEGDYLGRWNLFNNYFDEVFKDPSTIFAIIRVVFQLLGTLILRTNVISTKDTEILIKSFFKNNIIDENGQLPARVVVPRYTMPVSDFPYSESDPTFSEAKNRFYNCIPCKDIAHEKLGENFEDYLYVYNYSAFSFPSDNIAGLKEFVDTIVKDNKVGAKDVILVPMSMGASVVSAYLNEYPNAADNHVRRVVSIVGCWLGSDIISDLMTQSYVSNSPDLFYNGLIADLIGAPWGYVVNGVLRLFTKQSLRDFIDNTLQVLVKDLIGVTPSLCALIPVDKYDNLRQYIAEWCLPETDYYHDCQASLQDRLAALEAQGIDVKFISGYGVPYGGISSDYSVFGFMASAETTNSDEIIDIKSTAPGTSYVTYNQQFADEDGRRLSPDKTIDAATAYYPDSCWYFYGQKHELEYNNTAISLAIELALGNIKTVDDCDNFEEDGYYYPQFNLARTVKGLQRDYIPDFEKYIANGGTASDEQIAVYEKAVAMLANHENNPEYDNQCETDLYKVLCDLGVNGYVWSEPEEEGFFDKLLRKGNDVTYSIFGAKGYFDPAEWFKK